MTDDSGGGSGEGEEDVAELQRDVSDFAAKCCSRIESALAGPPADEPLRVIRSPRGLRYSFEFRRPLKAERNPALIGYVEVHFTVGRDRAGRYMAVYESAFKLLDMRRRPILRMEYLREPVHVPSSHLHIHAQSGPLTLFLAKTGHKTPAAVESLHIPTGGERFRPCVEDFLEFLIAECGVEGSGDWREQIDQGRAEWRDYQARSVIRERPEVAAEILRELGAKVELPESGLQQSPRNAY